MDYYLKDNLDGMQNYLKDLFEVSNQSKDFYRSLVSAVTQNILTVGYVRNIAGEINSGYALEKLKMSKYYIDWVVKNCEKCIGDEYHE